MEDGEWDLADNLFNSVLNTDPQCAEAYIGMAMVKHNFTTMDKVKALLLDTNLQFFDSTYIRRAEKYADGELKELLMSLRSKRESAIAGIIQPVQMQSSTIYYPGGLSTICRSILIRNDNMHLTYVYMTKNRLTVTIQKMS